MLQFVSVLRFTTRVANTPRPLPFRLKFHSFSSVHRTPTSFLRSSISFSPHSIPTASWNNRSLSLGSFLTWTKPTETPSPGIVANIARIEAGANAAPNDMHKQLALFQALVDTKSKAGYELVITRWERMCEFDPDSPLLRSDVAFQFYLTALNNSGLEKSINAAVRRRESVLASHPAPDVPAAESAEVDSPSPTTAFTSTKSDIGVRLRSQEIAQAVMSGTAASPLVPPSAQAGASPENAQLAGALASGAGNERNPIHVSVATSKGALIVQVLKTFMTMMAIVCTITIMGSILFEHSGVVKVGPRQAEFELLQQKAVKFSDVHGVDEVKEELADIVEFLKDPTIFATLGGKLPKGVLLTGPPGTGKTMLARAVAGEAGVPFLFASGSEFEEMFVGVGAKRVRELFATARKKQPAIIFIDELDAVGGKRSSRDQQYMKQTLNQLLVEMDGFLQTEGVIVIAATNFPESLDSALTRPGRFDRVIAVPLPDIRGRVQILQHYMRDVIASPEADPTVLARGTAGFSGADLENLVNQAAVQASKEGYREVMLAHFEWAKDRIIMGSERKSAYIDEKNKLMTAYHEGGHALALLYTEGAIPLHKVTCVPRGHSLGMTTYLPEADRLSMSLKEYQAEIDVCMGGRVAEAIIYGPDNVTSGASSDLQQATRTATAMVKNYGFSQKVGPVYYSDREETISPQTRENIDAEIRNILQAGEDRVLKLLKSKEHELRLLAHALVEHETLNADEVRKVIKGEPIRNIKDLIREDLTTMSTEPTVSLR